MILLVRQQSGKRALLFMRVIPIPSEDFSGSENQLKAKTKQTNKNKPPAPQRSNYEAIPSRRYISFLGLPEQITTNGVS